MLADKTRAAGNQNAHNDFPHYLLFLLRQQGRFRAPLPAKQFLPLSIVAGRDLLPANYAMKIFCAAVNQAGGE